MTGAGALESGAPRWVLLVNQDAGAARIMEVGGIDVASLAALRWDKGWTVPELAQVSGVEAQVVRRIEDGSVPQIARPHMEHLADALGVDPTNVAEFRPSLGLTAIGETGAGEGAETGARPHDA